MWKRIGNLWDAFRHISAVRSALQWLGFWDGIVGRWSTLVGALTATALGYWEHVARYPGPFIALSVLISFLAIIFFWKMIKSPHKSNALHHHQGRFPTTLEYGTTAYEDGRFLSAKSIGGEDMGEPVVIALTNTQEAKGGAAKQVVVKIEFDHDGGYHYTIRKAAWYILNGELFSGVRTAIDLESKESQSFRLFFKGPDGIVISENSVFPVGKLQEGHWSARMYASSVNSVTAYARASFKVFPGGRYEVMKIRSVNLSRDS